MQPIYSRTSRVFVALMVLAGSLSITPTALARTGDDRPVRQTGSTVYLPQIQAPWARITGRAASTRGTTAGHVVQLRSYQPGSGGATTLVATATVAIDNTYAFPAVPETPASYAYYVVYTAPVIDSTFLDIVYGPDAPTVARGAVLDLGTLDVTGIDLLEPGANATVAMPTTFRWARRATTTDNYFITVYDPAGVAASLSSPDLGYLDTDTAGAFPASAGYQTGVSYAWAVGVTTPDNALGYSFERRLTFSNIVTGAVTQGLRHFGQAPVWLAPRTR